MVADFKLLSMYLCGNVDGCEMALEIVDRPSRKGCDLGDNEKLHDCLFEGCRFDPSKHFVRHHTDDDHTDDHTDDDTGVRYDTSWQ